MYQFFAACAQADAGIGQSMSGAEVGFSPVRRNMIVRRTVAATVLLAALSGLAALSPTPAHAQELTFAVKPTTTTEDGGNATVTIGTGSGPTFNTDQTITLTLGGTATENTDYTIGAKSLTLTAGETSVTTNITATADMEDDDKETVTITAASGGDTIGAQATVTITETAPQLTISVSNGSIAEAAGTSTVTVGTGSGPTFDSDQTITLTLSGTATRNTDYTIGATTLTLTADETAVTTTVTAVQDKVDEPNETVLVTASRGADNIGSRTVTITDDDAAPAPTFSVSKTAIGEAADSATLTVSTGAGSTYSSSQTITLTLANTGTATPTADFILASTSLTLPAGSGNNASQITTTLTAVQDKIDEPNETVLVTASRGADNIGSRTVTITDDDAAPAPTFSVSKTAIGEAADSATLTVSTGAGSTYSSSQTITLTLANTGTATRTADFTLASTSLTLPAGSGNNASQITTTLTAVQDKIDEPNETVLVTARRGADNIGSQQTVTITDDDAAPAPTFSVSKTAIGEAADSATLTVSTGTGSTYPSSQTITLTLANTGTATRTADFTLASTSLTLPAGSGNAASRITTTLTAVQDKIDEPNETVLVTASRGAEDIGSQQTVTITDDDAAPVLALDVSSATIAEAAGTTTVTVTTGTGSTFATEQTITLTFGGTATATDDYTIGATELKLPAGMGTAASAITTTITAVDDDFFEGTTNEQITVRGARGGSNFGVVRTVSIIENEARPKLTLTLTDDSIPENDGATTVTASVAPRTVDAFTVSFAITPNAPATADDYDITGTLSFAALSAASTGTVTITANDNRVDRSDKTVSVTGTSSRSYFQATDAVTLTLEDDDLPPAPVLEVATSPIAEDGGTSVLTVTTGDGSTYPDAKTVILTLTGTAAEDADYAIVSKSLVLPAGSGNDVSSVTTTVTAIDDIIDDNGDAIAIDAAIDSTAVGTRQTIVIADDDDAPVVTVGVSPGVIGENGDISTVTVTTNTGESTFAAAQTITLTLTGTATEGGDYTVRSKTLTLPAGVGMNHAQITTPVTGLNDVIDEADEETILIDARRATGPTTSVAVGTRQTVRVRDDDGPPVLKFETSATQIGENGGSATLKVTTGSGSTFEEEQTITLSVAEDGTAIENSDYSVGSKTMTLPAGTGLQASVATTTVTGIDDANYEGLTDQTFTVSAAHGESAIGTPITIRVKDDESPSRTALVLSRTAISEDSDAISGESVISATVSPPAEVGFWLRTCWTGPVGRVHGLGRFQEHTCNYIEFESGKTSSKVTSPPTRFYGNDNELADGDARITISGVVVGFDAVDTYTEQPNPLPGILAPAPVTLTVTDDDSAATTVTLSVDDAEVGEGAGATAITVTGTLSGETPAGATSVTLSVESGAGTAAALAGTDFARIDDFVLTIPAGQASATATFTLTPTEDSIDEPAETLTLAGATDAVGVGIAGTVTIAIADNDEVPAPVLSVVPDSIAENGGTTTVTVSTGSGSTYPTPRTITLTLTGTATEGSDYTIGAKSLVLPAGVGTAASQVGTTITAVEDAEADPLETVIVSGSVDGEAFGTARTVRIDDNEGTPTVTLVLTPAAVFEGGTSKVTARVAPVSAVPFDVTVGATAQAPHGPGDFTLNGTTLSFAAGAALSTGAVTIDADDDDQDNDDKTITVSGTVSASGVTAPQNVNLTIRDDENAVTLSLEVVGDSIAEDGGVATVTVSTGTGATFEDAQTIGLSLGGSATPGVDYTIGSSALVLEAGGRSVSTTVTGMTDDVFEGNETVTVSATLDGIGFGAEQAITIIDDDTAPTVTLVLTPDAIAEDDGASTVTATLSAPSAVPFDVTVRAEAVAPAVPEDFTLAGGTLSFAPNGLTSTGAVTVSAADNPVDAPDKQVRVTGTVSDARFAAPDAVFLTIEDDDEASNSVTLSVSPAEIAEAGGPTEVTVTATFSAGAREQASEFVISVLGGAGSNGARADVDFNAVDDFILTIPASETSGSETFTFTPRQDRIREGNEVLSISAASADPDIGVGDAPTVTLTDDDAQPALALEVDRVSMDENGGTAEVTVSTGAGSTFPAARTISLTLAGTATQDSDYAIGSTSLVLPAGNGQEPSSVSTVVSALNDIVYEPSETVEVSGSLDGTGFGSAFGTATVSIVDDDETPAPVLSVNPDTILESGGIATVTVSTGDGATFDTEQTIFLTLAGTAVTDEDYTLPSVELTLPAGEGFDASSVSVEITAVEDEITEGDETVIVTGTLDGNAFGEAQTLHIADNEGAPRVFLELSTFTVNEDGGAVTVRGIVSPPASEAFTVTITVETDDPALADGLTLSGTTLRFDPGATESANEITITAVDNDLRDGDRHLVLSGTASLTSVTAPPEVALTIRDEDDRAAVRLALTPAAIAENGGVSTVTATLTSAVDEPLTVIVSASAVAPAVAGDFALSGTTLRFDPGATRSTGTITITAVDNDESAPDKTIAVSGTVSLPGVTAPADATLVISDDDGAAPPPLPQPPPGAPADLTARPDGSTAVELAWSPPADEITGYRIEASPDGREWSDLLTDTGNAGTSYRHEGLSGNTTVRYRVSAIGSSGISGPSNVATATTEPGLPTAPVNFRARPGEERITLVWSAPENDGGAPILRYEYELDGNGSWVDVGQTLTATLTDLVNGRAYGFAVRALNSEGPGPTARVRATAGNHHRVAGAWIGRFGRTVAEQILETVAGRMRATRQPGVRITLAGHGVVLDRARGAVATDPRRPGARLETLSSRLRGQEEHAAAQWTGTRPITARDVVAGSSFTLDTGAQQGGFAALWGRTAVSRFEGREGGLSLDGEVVSGMLGADWKWKRWSAGLIVSRSDADGGYRSEADTGGKVSAALTGLYPWGRYALNERLEAWGAVGYGRDDLTVTWEDSGGVRTRLDLRMAAAGLRGVLIGPGPNDRTGRDSRVAGLTLSATTDALIVQTSSGAARGSSSVPAVRATVTRLRLGLDGSMPMRLYGRSVLTPSAEIGVRRDGGEAETGLGLDIGGGLAWTDPDRGLQVELRGRGLLGHESAGFRESGFSGSLSWDPTPDDRGARLILTQTIGGTDALRWSRAPDGLAADDDRDDPTSRRMEMKFGYGFAAFGNHFTSTPEIGVGVSDTGRHYSLGWWLANGGGAFELSVEGRWQENGRDGAAAEHAVGLLLTARF